ncbi:MAG TPA: glycosyltransferase family 2 protein, partial [Candidatus Paceibacterota bacterium]
MHKLSIIIPSYNEARTIKTLIEKIKAVDLPAGKAGLGNVEKEIIVVDNGSTDETAQILKAVDGIRVLTLNPNRKKGGAVKAGIKEATGNIVIVQDADLEYDPNDYPAMIRPILDG